MKNICYESTSNCVLNCPYCISNDNGFMIYDNYMDVTNFIGKSDIHVYIVHLNVESGNFRLVVINDDKIIKDIPLDAFGETFYFEDLKGTFAIRVAGESAKCDFHIEVY